MISALILVPVLFTPAPCATHSPTPAPVQADAAYEKRLTDAGEDPDKLWELVIWCESTERDKESRIVLRRLLKLEPTHRRAHEKLGHIEYEDKWYLTQKRLDDHIAAEAKRKAKASGLVRYKGAWVRPEDIPYLKQGLVRDEAGFWVSKEEYRWSKQGYVRQDLRWIAPGEISQIEAGLWKCGDDWRALEAANGFHADVDHMWRIPGKKLIVRTTCDRGVALSAIREMESACADLTRIYGRAPSSPIEITVLRNEEQYDRFADGSEGSTVPKTDLTGLAAVHHAFFADGWLNSDAGEYDGMGAAYWDDSNEKKTRYGICAVRHAVGLSFAEALDPSPNAVGRAQKKAARARGGKAPIVDASWAVKFQAEKRIPRWFRYGAASYVERYYYNADDIREGDAWFMRKWSIGDIKGGFDGLEPLNTIFEFDLERAGHKATHLLNEAGLLVAFVIDGDCGPVKRRHEIVVETIRNGKDPRSAFQALQKTIAKSEAALLEFAGI